MEYREDECRGFTRARLCQPHHVLAFKDMGDRPLLNRCRAFEIRCGNTSGNHGMKMKNVKIQSVPSFCAPNEKSPGEIPGLT
jgi:hypothetical protein